MLSSLLAFNHAADVAVGQLTPTNAQGRYIVDPPHVQLEYEAAGRKLVMYCHQLYADNGSDGDRASASSKVLEAFVGLCHWYGVPMVGVLDPGSLEDMRHQLMTGEGKLSFDHVICNCASQAALSTSVRVAPSGSQLTLGTLCRSARLGVCSIQ